jgi:hypothetical protein
MMSLVHVLAPTRPSERLTNSVEDVYVYSFCTVLSVKTAKNV